MSYEASEQYMKALKNGQKYMKNALAQETNPYPAVLDEVESAYETVGRVELGLQNIPTELIVGTRSAGRTAALAGNFMPLLDMDSEFATKWIRLCEAHMEEGIRDPILAYEFLGKFYVQEGNKRVSVLKSFDAPTVAANVIRVLPARSEDPEIKLYYEFLQFFNLSGLYGLSMEKPGSYAKLQAALGMKEDHIWTEDERRSFRSGFARFQDAYAKMKKQPAAPAEALLVWLQVFKFSDIKEMGMSELVDNVAALWTDMKLQNEQEIPSIEVQAELPKKDMSLVSKIITAVSQPEKIKVAFIYGFDPKTSSWTNAHELGRQAMVEALEGRVEAMTYIAKERDYFAAMSGAVEDGAELIFATTPPMIDACRKIAAMYKNVKVFNCALSQPYTGVTMYYSRIYECKFITGAIAGAMAANDRVGYISGYPIFGEPAAINAFALGVRMVNPRARVDLLWSCTRRDCAEELRRRGISVISNREAVGPEDGHWAFEWGTWLDGGSGDWTPLAVPCWNWGALYEKLVRSALKGSLETGPADKAVNFWFGLDSGVVDVRLSDSLPYGVRSLALMLKRGLAEGRVEPFRSRIFDQAGVLRCDGETGLSPETLMRMDWLCDNVDGTIPGFEELLPGAREMVRLLGLYRDDITTVKEEKQL
ncbi:MAG: BMP family ABC transporter substrate-binding protein [Oscillospiraceae bacterium]|nr:BMP family ABC transporter substrate-binding protein [Oscillospiraceae bacterium]